MNIKSYHLNQLYLSEKDMDLYKSVIRRKHLKEENIQDLYKLNLFISQEFYIIVTLIESIYKNKLHQKMTEIHGTQNWFNNIQWQPSEYVMLAEAAQKKLKLTSPVRILDELTLKFWTQTFNKQYHDSLYLPAIKHLFPNYDGKDKLTRSVVKNIFAEMHYYRNNIAHQYVIIHEENKLFNSYHKFLKFIYWMDKDYYKLAVKHSRFLKYHKILVMSSFSMKGVLWYAMRKIRRIFNKHMWELIHIFYNKK